jgi:hypothetical protein
LPGRKSTKGGKPVDTVEILPDGTIVSVTRAERNDRPGKFRTKRQPTQAKRGKLTIIRGRKVPQ